MTDELYQALKDCIQLSARGMDPVEYLARYPEQADELEPLLLAAINAVPASEFRMSREAKTQTRLRVMAEWDQRQATSQHWPWASQMAKWGLPKLEMPKLGVAPRWAMATAVFAMAVFLGGAGTVAASQDSVPGHPLYAVKELREGARLWFARSSEEKASIYTGLVQERARELQELASMRASGASPNTSGDTTQAVARLEQHISEAHQLAAKAGPDAGVDLLSVEASISQTLGQALVKLDGSENLLGTTLEGSSPAAYPCLSHTYRTLQQARQQVNNALEGIGRSAPTPATAGTQGSLCPP